MLLQGNKNISVILSGGSWSGWRHCAKQYHTLRFKNTLQIVWVQVCVKVCGVCTCVHVQGVMLTVWMLHFSCVVHIIATSLHHYTQNDCTQMWASALCICFYINPALLNGSTQFHYCTDSNPGTGADDVFVLKRGVWCNATWPLHSWPAIAASARHFQICFSPLTFWPLVCLPTLYWPSPFYALSHE